MSNPEDINYKVTAEDRFGRTFQNLKRDLVGLGDQSDVALGRLGKLNTGLGLLALGAAGAGAGLLAGIRNLANDLDALNDASDATGETVENLSALEDVARRNGESLDIVTTSISRLNKTLGDSDPNSGAAQALQRLGLSAAELRQYSPAEALQRVAIALQGVANDGNKARLVQELFGKSIKEVAPFLNDLAEAGKLNSTVTSAVAKEAEKFNKALANLDTNANNAARSLTSALLPAASDFLRRIADASKAHGGLMQGLADMQFGDMTLNDAERLTKARAEVDGYTTSLAKFQALQDKGSLSSIDAALMKNVEAKLAAARRRLEFQKLNQAAAALELDAAENGNLARLGRAKPLGEFTGAKTPKVKEPQTEAERYLETLQKQGEKMQSLSGYEQALLDVQKKRIAGITPALEREILAQARLNDQAKQAFDLRTAEIEARSRAGRASLEALAAMEQENTALEKEVQALGLSAAALADLELAKLRAAIATKEQTIAEREAAGVGEERLQQINAEIAALRKRSDLIVAKIEKDANLEASKAEIDKIGDHAKDTLRDSVGEGLLDGFRRGETVAETFLRELKAQFGKTILQPIISPIAEAGNNLIKDLLGMAADAVFGTGIKVDPNGTGIDPGGIGIPTRGGRANGGSVRAGGVYRVNENGFETFEPAVDGTIINAGETRRRTKDVGETYQFYNTFHVNGDVSPQTIAAMKAMIAQAQQQQLRSRRTGGAFA